MFEEIQQEVVLLLCEKNGTDEHLIEHIEVKDTEGLQALDPHRLNLPTKQIDFHADKWTYYFLDKEELEFLGRVRCENMPKIGKYANVEVGITTGATEEYFLTISCMSAFGFSQSLFMFWAMSFLR